MGKPNTHLTLRLGTWSVRTDGGVRSTMVVDTLPGTTPPRYVVYVGDAAANMYALDARTGKELWKVDVDDHPLSTITGTPKTHGNRLYVSTTALEEIAGSDPTYQCCTCLLYTSPSPRDS